MCFKTEVSKDYEKAFLENVIHTEHNIKTYMVKPFLRDIKTETKQRSKRQMVA